MSENFSLPFYESVAEIVSEERTHIRNTVHNASTQ